MVFLVVLNSLPRLETKKILKKMILDDFHLLFFLTFGINLKDWKVFYLSNNFLFKSIFEGCVCPDIFQICDMKELYKNFNRISEIGQQFR